MSVPIQEFTPEFKTSDGYKFRYVWAAGARGGQGPATWTDGDLEFESRSVPLGDGFTAQWPVDEQGEPLEGELKLKVFGGGEGVTDPRYPPVRRYPAGRAVSGTLKYEGLPTRGGNPWPPSSWDEPDDGGFAPGDRVLIIASADGASPPGLGTVTGEHDEGRGRPLWIKVLEDGDSTERLYDPGDLRHKLVPAGSLR